MLVALRRGARSVLGGSAVPRLRVAAPVPVLTMTDLSHEFQGTMPDGAVRLRGFLHASADQTMARRWRDQR